MVYRNIYVTRYKRLPLFKMKGNTALFYTGCLKFVNEIDTDFDNKKDLLIDCDCQLQRYKSIEKINK